MTNPINTSFRGVYNFGDSLTTTQLETNLMSWLDWSMICIGAFQNVKKSEDFAYLAESSGNPQLLTENSLTLLNGTTANAFLGAYGGEPAVLRPVTDPNYIDGTVFEGFRQNWVWESNIDYGYQPIAISGVYIDNLFIPKESSGTYSHHVDYPAGRVVFDLPLSGTPKVTCEYSFRHVRVDLADSPWFQKIQFNSYRIDDPDFLLTGSGAWNILSQNRVQLPAIVIEPVLNVSRKGYALGDYTTIHTQDVMFNILAETDYDRKQIHDILIMQEEIVIPTFDKDTLLGASGYPLNPDGSLVSGAMNYRDIVTSGVYDWKSKIRFKQMKSYEIESAPPLYRSAVRGSFDLYLP